MTLYVESIPPTVTETALAPLLGGRAGQPFSNALTATVRFWRNRLDQLIEPRIAHKKVGIEAVSRSRVRLVSDCHLTSPKLSRTLRGCQEAVCFLATLGTRIEREVRRLFKEKKMADAYVLDAMGSVAVENMVDRFQESVQADSQTHGQNVTLRFSPGYCDWAVTEQKKLFGLMAPGQIGVQLNSSCLMNPRKSISGIFGILPSNSTEAVPYNPCIDCTRRDCPSRRN